MRPPLIPLFLVCSAFLISPGNAGTKILVIGDSLTKEYQITFPGLPGVVDGIDPDNPSARNWVEILSARRPDLFDLGTYKSTPFFNQWSDLRLIGHEYNWAVPGATARHTRDLLTGQNMEEIEGDEDISTLTAFAPDWKKTGERITAQLPSAGGVVILLGGNDLRYGSPDPSASVGGTKITYGTIHSGNGTGAGNPQPLMDSIKASIQQVVSFVRATSPNIPLAVCAVPHVGAAPVVRGEFPLEAAGAARATAALDALNAELKTWTETTAGGVWVDTTYAVTKSLVPPTVDIGGVVFQNAPDPLGSGDSSAAHNRYLFASDGFHPGTALQALVARGVLDGLRSKYPAVYGSAAPLAAAEIVTDVCKIPAATGFTEFLAAASVPENARGPLDDPDRDGLPNLTEFALAGLSPSAANANGLAGIAADLSGPSPVATLSWTPRSAENIACVINCQASADLAAWSDVADAQVTTDASTGVRTARVPVPAAGQVYLRLKVSGM